MNKKQKILTAIGLVAFGFWALLLGETWRNDQAATVGALLFIIVAYAGLFFMLKSPAEKK